MEILVKVLAKSEVQNVQTSDATLQKLEVMMACGENQIIAAAFDKTALSIAAMQIDPASLYVADVTFSLSRTEKKFQNVRLNRLNAF